MRDSQRLHQVTVLVVATSMTLLLAPATRAGNAADGSVRAYFEELAERATAPAVTVTPATCVVPAATVVPIDRDPYGDPYGDDRVASDHRAYAGDPTYRRPLEATVWTDRGRDAIYQVGERVEVRFRVDDDAYVCIYDVDTEGRLRVLFPGHPDEDGFVPGGLVVSVPSVHDDYELVAGGPPGIELVAIVASRTPFGAFWGDGRWPGDPAATHDYGWEEPRAWNELDRVDWEISADDHPAWSVHGLLIAGDPFVAMRRINRHLLQTVADDVDYATDYVPFHVARRVRYPRYLCNDCHGYQHRYDPYADHCSVFSVRINLGWRYVPRRVHVIDDRWPTCYVYVRHARVPDRYLTIRRTWSSRERHELGDRFRRRLDRAWTPPPKSTRVYRKSGPDKPTRGYDWKTDDRRRRPSSGRQDPARRRPTVRVPDHQAVPPAASRPPRSDTVSKSARAANRDEPAERPGAVRKSRTTSGRGDAAGKSGAGGKIRAGDKGKSGAKDGAVGESRSGGKSKSGGTSRSGGKSKSGGDARKDGKDTSGGTSRSGGKGKSGGKH